MSNTYDTIIIGAGPAGVTAAIYASRKKLKTLLITKDFVGQVGKAGTIENYPGFDEINGLALLDNFRKQLEKFEVKIREGEEVREIQKNENFEVRTGPKKAYFSKTIIIASGKDPRPLEVPGEKDFVGKGVSYCVTCDGPLFKGKSVAVIGGGNSGFRAASELAKICPKVYILEFKSEPNADEAVQEKIKKFKNVEIISDIAVKEIRGKNFVESLAYENRVSKKTEEIKVNGIFVEVGYVPATSFVKNLVALNGRDEIKVDKNCATSASGIFAAGDITDEKYKQMIIAAGQGAKAGLSAYEYIQNAKED